MLIINEHPVSLFELFVDWSYKCLFIPSILELSIMVPQRDTKTVGLTFPKKTFYSELLSSLYIGTYFESWVQIFRISFSLLQFQKNCKILNWVHLTSTMSPFVMSLHLFYPQTVGNICAQC